MSNVVIETKALTKFYGSVRGIEDLSFKINQGELFGFLGPNGAGKSTTIRLMLNLLKPSSGRIYIFGKELKYRYTQIFKHIGNVPGELKLYEELSGSYFLEYMNRFNQQKANLRDELIESFQLSQTDLDKKIKYYSRGMKQKLAIIQSMQEEPDVLIMDEPSEGLDPLNKNVLYEYLLKFKNQGKTIFFSSHNLSEVEKISDHVGLVKNGRFIAHESITDLKKKMVRRMEVEFIEDIDINDFNFSTIKHIEKTGRKLLFQIRGDLNPLIQTLSKYQIKNLIFPEPSLEDMFMTFYSEH
jgi:ABC-2 type transport system ATP-binding protein